MKCVISYRGNVVVRLDDNGLPTFDIGTKADVQKAREEYQLGPNAVLMYRMSVLPESAEESRRL